MKTFLTNSQPGYVLSMFSKFWLKKKADRKRKKRVESYHVTQQGVPDKPIRRAYCKVVCELSPSSLLFYEPLNVEKVGIGHSLLIFVYLQFAYHTKNDPTKGACRRRSSSPSSSPYPCKKATLRLWTPFFADRLISVDELLRITTGSFVHVLSRSVGGKVRGILHRGKCNQYLLFSNAFAFSLPLRNSYLRNGDS